MQLWIQRIKFFLTDDQVNVLFDQVCGINSHLDPGDTGCFECASEQSRTHCAGAHSSVTDEAYFM